MEIEAGRDNGWRPLEMEKTETKVRGWPRPGAWWDVSVGCWWAVCREQEGQRALQAFSGSDSPESSFAGAAAPTAGAAVDMVEARDVRTAASFITMIEGAAATVLALVLGRGGRESCRQAREAAASPYRGAADRERLGGASGREREKRLGGVASEP